MILRLKILGPFQGDQMWVLAWTKLSHKDLVHKGSLSCGLFQRRLQSPLQQEEEQEGEAEPVLMHSVWGVAGGH